MTEHAHEQSLTEYLAVFRRRKWIVLVALVVAPAAAVALSLQQAKLFSAGADVLLTSAATGAQSPLDPTTSSAVQTQVEIASSPAIARKVVKATGITSRSAGEVLAEESVTGSSDGNVLHMSITDGNPAIAVQLANAFAREYVSYRRQLDTSFISGTRREIEARLRALRASGDRTSSLYLALAQKDQDLLELQALQTVDAVVLRPASGAAQVQPRPTRNGIIGLGIGLVLGIGLALLWDAVDNRIRSAHEVTLILGQPLLGRLSAPSRRLRADKGLVMLDDPESPEAEAFRQLRSSLDFANADVNAKVIMVTSALREEGKSTTTANLAVALARAGREVVLVDLDLREPSIHKFFRLQGYRWIHGLTSVALGRVSLDDAIADVPVGGELHAQGEESREVLHVLPSGPVPNEPGEFVGTAAVRSVLEQLRQRAEFVLVDAPPILGIGDAASLSPVVDGIIVVARLGKLRRPVLHEARRLLDATPVPMLGYVMTDAEREQSYGYRRYGYYRYGAAPTALRLERRYERERQ